MQRISINNVNYREYVQENVLSSVNISGLVEYIWIRHEVLFCYFKKTYLLLK